MRLRSATRSDPSRSSRSPPADRSCPSGDGTRSQGSPGPAAAPFARWRVSTVRWGSRGATATLKGTPQAMAHTRFGFMWNWDGGEHVILSRATDETGHVQPTREEVAKFLDVAYTPKFRPPGNNNTIMPWKIGRDGSVTNGLAWDRPDFAAPGKRRPRADIWRGARADRSRTCPGYHDRSNRSGTASGPRHCRGRQSALYTEELLRLSWPGRRRRGDIGAQFAGEERPGG